MKIKYQHELLFPDCHDYFIDLFCGAGGTTTGLSKRANVIVCINHDKNAILSHSANHPNALHLIEDIRTANLQPVLDIISKIRAQDPLARFHVWASLECTNHSNAKGGMSRDADSRTLAEHLFRYIETINPDMVWIENVREFKDWGPLRIKAKSHENYSELIFSKPTKKNPIPMYVMVPDKRFKGRDYNEWVRNVQQYGYNYEYKILNAADYGCDTSRRRLYIQFAKPEIKISWPLPTHEKDGKNGLQVWRPVRPLLDLEDCGKSIFDKKKPWVEASLRRKLRGLKKFVHEPFLVKYYGKGFNAVSTQAPCPTLTVKERMYFMQSEYGKSIGSSIENPHPTLLKNPKESLITVNFLKLDYSHGAQCRSLNRPAPALMANKQKESLMTVNFLYDHQFNNGGNSIDKPCPTIIARQDKKPIYLLTATSFLMDTNFNNTGTSLDSPAPTLIACRKRNELVTAEGGMHPLQWIFDVVKEKYKDSPAMAEIVQFMIDNNIGDIKIRPLRIKEMLRITGFPENYILIGTQAEQKKYIGNAVPCYQVEAIVGHSIDINRSKMAA